LATGGAGGGNSWVIAGVTGEGGIGLMAVVLALSVGKLAGVGDVGLLALMVGLAAGELAGEGSASFLIAFILGFSMEFLLLVLGLSMEFLLLVLGLSMEFLLLEAVCSMTGGDKALFANNAIAPTVPNAARTDKGMRNRFCLGSDEVSADVEFLEDVEL
jgi:Zn-dependent protease with chaperone function